MKRLVTAVVLALLTSPAHCQDSDEPGAPAPRPADAETVEERARVLLQQARAAGGAADFEGAREMAARAIDELLIVTDEQAPEARVALLAELGRVALGHGDTGGGERAWRRVHDLRSALLSDEDPLLQEARLNLASALRSRGQLSAALELQELALEVSLRTLGRDHSGIQTVRVNLAATLFDLGDLTGSRTHLEAALEVYSRTLPDDHHNLQAVRANLASTVYMQRDYAGARALQEKALEVLSRTRPETDRTLQMVRDSLAITLSAQGDQAAARVLQERSLSALSRMLPDDHPVLQKSRLGLSGTLFRLGEYESALVLQEQALEALSRTVPESSPDLQRARLSHAGTLSVLGEHIAAIEALRQVVDAVSRTLPDRHPDLLGAQSELAAALARQGDLTEARALHEKVLEVTSWLPDEHREVQAARLNLALNLASIRAWDGDQEGLSDRFAELATAFARGKVRDAAATFLDASTREAEERCAYLLRDVGRVLSFASGLGGVFPINAGLEREAFILSEVTRSAAETSARLGRLAGQDADLEGLRARAREASTDIARLARSRGTRAEIEAAVARRDAAVRQWITLLGAQHDDLGEVLDFDPEVLAASIAKGSAAVAYRRYTRHVLEEDFLAERFIESLCAFVVRSEEDGGALRRFELGPIEPIESAARNWRDRLAPRGGPGSSGSTIRGRPARATGPTGSSQGDLARALGELVLDPLRPGLERVDRLLVVLDDVLHTVPFDLLPAEEGVESSSCLGDRFVIEQHRTLQELLFETRTSEARPTLLVLGGAAFNAPPLGPTSEAGEDEDSGSRSPGVVSLLRGGAWEHGFEPLPGTISEAEGIATLFGRTAGSSGRSSALVGQRASRESIQVLAPQARWLHIATHGWFAPETLRSWEDPASDNGSPGRGRGILGSSPMALCGLALAGANLAADAVGRYQGLITAEEISTWDLSNCELAVLSACDTNVGIRRAGQGVASLQKALHMAGARSVITSLWKVPDQATRELMLDFYHRLWVEKKPKHQALWEAKMRLRNAKDVRGNPRYSSGDWAAWVLTGEPDQR